MCPPYERISWYSIFLLFFSSLLQQLEVIFFSFVIVLEIFVCRLIYKVFLFSRLFPKHAGKGSKSKDWSAHSAVAGGGSAGSGAADQGDAAPVPDVGVSLHPHAASFRFREAETLLAAKPVQHAALLPPAAAAGVGLDRVLSAVVHGDAFLYLLLHGRNKGSVFGCESAEKTILEVSHQVHDVVSKTWRAKNY